MQKILLDTNIIIDFLGERKGFYDPAAKIITLADKKKIKIYVSAVSMATAYYVLAKYENKKAALEKCRKFKVLCEISSMNNKVFEKALNAPFDDFEDALQYFSAVEDNCDLIVTRNEKDYKTALIPVMNPENYLQTLKQQ
ncbi:MAG: PilT protein domain-containing protein [Proteiniphilum acetatigenes]|uniref:PilT protein domain-containing protein n=1 Tax=Proteiniphilum acetatigenes TaxID=294710 RepID=A0A101HJS3_9BACT|nr:MAG: PilT protein domain-containing protein [Proteiniphilum acetatigenes]KUL19012.1 MAG: PilT protein domain-containing protein [Proteiniphilum sp. 51_7]HCC85798.1 PIN domain nuclease [Porphyromonadaceae bacterium]